MGGLVETVDWSMFWFNWIYTVSQKKPTQSFCDNFAKRGPILIILSTFYSQMNWEETGLTSATSPKICCRITLRNLNVEHFLKILSLLHSAGNLQ